MKTYVLCTSLEQHSVDTLKRIKNLLDLRNAIVHIVTIFELKMYTLNYIPYTYPTESLYDEMDTSAQLIMRSLAKDLGLSDGQIVINCFFDSNRKNKIKSYLVDVEADLVVTATRVRHGIEGFFSSSFTDYLCKFSPCDVLVIRPEIHQEIID